MHSGDEWMSQREFFHFFHLCSQTTLIICKNNFSQNRFPVTEPKTTLAGTETQQQVF